MRRSCDFLVIGSGLAGMTYALKVAHLGKVILLAKTNATNTNTDLAQGGIASVTSKEDSFAEHVQDTLTAGAGLTDKSIATKVVTQGPARIEDLQKWGVEFDLVTDEGEEKLDQRPGNKKFIDRTVDGPLALTREGGHTKRRILHHQDSTGHEIQKKLLEQVKAHPNIEILENHFAIDLLVSRKANPNEVGQNKCFGAYVLNTKSPYDVPDVHLIKARITVLATGGAGKVYLYTSNWQGATGDGIAMAYRAGARVANLEFMQFHPTCLYHPNERNFLITEAIRGEGGELINHKGEAFMKKHHPMGSLAPRDIVARSIDAEMKKTGAECVYLDIRHKGADFLQNRFPMIYEKCKSLGIDIAKQPIPVVPAAHYLCGGIIVDEFGRTDLHGLFAIGEAANTGLHGANRLASNSLLESIVFGHEASQFAIANWNDYPMSTYEPKDWQHHYKSDADEMVVITQLWDEIRRLMWNYVGIVRTNRRLERAMNRLQNIQSEIREYYWDFKVHPDILELRNIALVAELTVRCALLRKESRGIHYNTDYPHTLNEPKNTIISGLVF